MSNRKFVFMTVLPVAILSSTTLACAQDTPQASAPSAPISKKEMRAQNRQLAKRVRIALVHTKNLSTTDITVLANGSHVTLVGTTPDDNQIQLAGDVASKVNGVGDLTNNLTVREIGH